MYPTMKAVLMDMGGVLRDLRPNYEAFLHALEKHNVSISLSYDEYRRVRCISRSSKEALVRLLQIKKYNLDSKTMDDVINTYKHLYYSTTRELFPWTVKALKLMKSKGYRLAIVSDASESSIMEDLGEVIHLFEIVLGRESVPKKPSAGGIQQACKYMGISPREAYYVGDSKIDAEAAKAAGAVSVGVISGFCTKDLVEEFFELAFDNILKFAEWLPATE